MLLMIGCDHAQGYGIARPMAADKVPDWLNHYQVEPEWPSCAAKPLTARQKALYLFELTSQRWYQQFVTAMNHSGEESESWPIIDQGKCHCGSWIQRVKTQGLFDALWLDRLEQAHTAWHQIAIKIREMCMTGQAAKSRQYLDEMVSRFEAMQTIVNSALPSANQIVSGPEQADNTPEKDRALD